MPKIPKDEPSHQTSCSVELSELAQSPIITLSPSDAVKFWEMLQAPPALTAAQKELGRLMRGEMTPDSAK
jgi:hypothetical protein